MGAVGAAPYQYLKYPPKEKIIKIRSNLWLAHDYNEKSFDGFELSNVNDMQILEIQKE